MNAIEAVTEPARRTELYGTFDVVVLGGGPAGIAAAVAAGRAGAATLLIERYGFLGGMGTAAGVTNFCGLHANRFGARSTRWCTDCRRSAGRHRAAGRPEGAATIFGKIQGPGL